MWVRALRMVVVVLAAVVVCSVCLAGEGDEAAFIGCKTSKVYHKPDCASVKKIKPENKISFKSEDEAKEAGYEPCKRCVVVSAKEGKFVGSKEANVYHKPDCPAVKKISKDNKVYFQSEEEAKEAGFAPCKKCIGGGDKEEGKDDEEGKKKKGKGKRKKKESKEAEE